MKVVLLKDVKKIGQRGAAVTVADGYAMNVLIPQKLAVTATPENLKRVEKEALALKGKKDMDAALAKKALEMVNGKMVTIRVKANDAGGLFQALHEKQISDALADAFQVSLPESAIGLEGPIKKTGTYSVPVTLHGAKGFVSIEVI